MWLLGVVLRRYIDFLILLIPTPLVSVLFCSSIPTFFVHLKKCFSFLFQYFLKNYILGIKMTYTLLCIIIFDLRVRHLLLLHRCRAAASYVTESAYGSQKGPVGAVRGVEIPPRDQ